MCAETSFVEYVHASIEHTTKKIEVCNKTSSFQHQIDVYDIVGVYLAVLRVLYPPLLRTSRSNKSIILQGGLPQTQEMQA